MIRVKELQLQIVSLTDALLQLGGRLNQIRLSEVVQDLQLLDDLLLVLHDLVLFFYLCLDASNFYLLLTGLHLDQTFQVGYIALSH
jgi:hypothetical protein